MEVRNSPGNPVPASPNSSKQSKPSPNPVDSHSVSQRLQKELMALMYVVHSQESFRPKLRFCVCDAILVGRSKLMSADPGISAFPEAENIFYWIGTIKGSKGTAYEGLSYKLSLRFPLDYPFKPPQVKFETMCFHPNVDQYANICLDILQDKWSSAYDCRTVLLSIQSLLGEPNNESPLNSYAAGLWSNQDDYRKVVLKQYADGGGIIEG